MEKYFYNDFDTIFAALGVGIIIVFLLGLAILVLGIVANWKLFEKGSKEGWKALIPFYNYYVLTEIAELNWWWFLLMIANSLVSFLGLDELFFIASLVSLFAKFNCYYNIARKFGKDKGIAICAGIFSYIFTFIFAFSKGEVYDGSISVSANGIFESNGSNSFENNNNNMMNESTSSVDKNDVKSENVNKKYMYCGECGTKLDNDVKFCPNCGKKIL